MDNKSLYFGRDTNSMVDSTMITCQAKSTDLWPEENEINLPNQQMLLPLFSTKTPTWKKVLIMFFIRRKYMFESNYITYIPCINKYCLIRKFFTHDWASIPMALRGLSSADGIFAYGAPVHDFGYRFSGLFLADEKGEVFTFTKVSRKDLDKIFTNRNDISTGLLTINKVAYNIIRWFGALNYAKVDVETVEWNAPF